MPNEYKSFYFADLKATIREVALEAMLTADIYSDDIDTLKDALIATYNDGIKSLATALIEKLTDEAKE